MTISSWVAFGFIVLLTIIGSAIVIDTNNEKAFIVPVTILIALCICVGSFFCFRWYHHNTASGIRALTDQKAELNNGLNREINIYTADGNLIAHYEGQIYLEDNEGGYVLFEYEGKRYTYYNCFVESIADIEN